MAQLRQDYDQFVAREAEILVVGPEDQPKLARYWQKENLPFVGLPDPAHTVANRYKQRVNLLKVGRLPAVMIIDKQGQIRYRHFGQSMRDIPENTDLLTVLDHLNQSG